MKYALAACALLVGFVSQAHAAAWTLACPDGVKKLPRLLGDTVELEPSGVAWDPVHRMAVAVSDEASPYALLAFDPALGAGGKSLRAFPLLTPAQVEQFQPHDLEGITRLPDGSFVAAASMSLNKGKPQETLLRFRLKKGEGDASWSAVDLTPLAVAGGWHAWLGAAHPPWEAKFNGKEGDSGINMEGLAATMQEDRLLFGFRGPAGGRIALLRVERPASGMPRAAQWHALKPKGFDSGGILGVGTDPLGIRDMAPVGENGYLLLLGASGSGSDVPFQLGWWQEGQEEIALVGKIPKGFRAEGVTVMASGNGVWRLLLVSDKMGYIMECDATRKK